ncbi:MAG: biopolymer transporter ExbD [Planctomycetia bacterium]|jgi:biopolymer transport protein ExbD|nr:biopolymer transporter ExbD [Planctomycetia bacterium]NCG13331.1 biopolymer transporter ExbD [Planctomycetia bacterium]NCG56684.1 biopolymer transporter ExbD [Pseudomonadota bacterium]
MKSKRSSALEEASVNMSPMIDMTFLLLIFFIVNMNFTKETGIEIKRPSAVTAEAKSGDVILVGISSAGTIHMNGKRIDLSNVRPAVSRARNKTPKAACVVVADEAVRTGLLTRVIDECKLAGAGDISVATRSGG